MFKVYFHCLFKTFANLRGEDHRMSWVSQNNYFDSTYWFCTCGYPEKRS
jgi:hypothetical protein